MVAELSFTIFSYLGVWRPETWTSKWSIRVYNIYNFFILTFEYYYAFTFLISLFQNIHIAGVRLQNLFFFSSIFLLAFKVTYVGVYREEIIFFKNMFLEKKCLPRNKEERKIVKTLIDKERFNSRIFVLFALLTSTLYTLLPLTSKEINSLPYECWIPFNVSTGAKFWGVYLYECISIYLATLLFASMETLPSIMMQQICIQLEILIYRILEIPKLRNKYIHSKLNVYQEEYRLLKECINHHDFIFLMEHQLNKIFGLLICVQFFVSTINLCISGFYITSVNFNNAYFWVALVNLSTFIFQIFLQCFFGELMTRKSLSIADEIYKMDWSLLNIRSKQKLIIIMMRSNRPMQLNGFSLLTMSIETFCKVLRHRFTFL
ncbi:odorant receptor 4-like isoform X2 [Leptopilina boulardi]|uniref:odorant receptor 4-like isoform X2 n=1 Tax=Leptopilina boulardi TaxID=63433 RepID=UPI0021F68C9D|nr:odorant receptor 4-like isoform X2 [Leptopilina boulardi]